jgi:hypothetical protein
VALFFRLFVIAFGYSFGALAAGAVLIIATLPAGSFENNLDHADWLILWWAILTAAAIVGALAFVPAMVVILIAESFSLRSLFFYALSGGAGGLLYGLTFPAAAPPYDRTVQITFAAGVAAGLIYWLVAGRNAGLWRGSSVRSAENI